MISCENPVRQLESITSKAYAFIADSFPVCTVSDEFYFFPQVVQQGYDWSAWDDFSSAKMTLVADRLLHFEQELLHLSTTKLPCNELIDSSLLHRTLRTLREQLLEVAPQTSQPTFHLLVLAAGLAQALSTEEKQAWPDRVAGGSAFLRRAADCLEQVPELFMRLALEMLHDLQSWLHQLQAIGKDVGELPMALRRFQAELHQSKVITSYRMPEDLFEKVVSEHIGCGVNIDTAEAVMHDELQAMEELLIVEAASLAPGVSPVDAQRLVPVVDTVGDLFTLYLDELSSLEAHCRKQRLVPDNYPYGAALEVAAIPHSLSAIRASDAYSASPGFPPRGGTFFVMEREGLGAGAAGRSLEYRMTAAHEAWPGHHLLDTCRWNLGRPLRRPLEFPLFYEGWACLAEELMLRTGYFDGPWDRFLLAKRRAQRAARGLVDLGLQSGRMRIDQAVDALVSVGYCPETARTVLPKYLLRPGYQVCYTFGLTQGLELLDRSGKDDVSGFSRTVLMQGEIGFDQLEKHWLK
jgi:hypothetical protein